MAANPSQRLLWLVLCVGIFAGAGLLLAAMLFNKPGRKEVNVELRLTQLGCVVETADDHDVRVEVADSWPCENDMERHREIVWLLQGMRGLTTITFVRGYETIRMYEFQYSYRQQVLGEYQQAFPTCDIDVDTNAL